MQSRRNCNENREKQRTNDFQIAVEDARRRFERQCLALGQEPSLYTVSSWAPETENEHHGKTLSIRTEEDGLKPVGLEPGKASLDIKVEVWFVHKDCLEIG